MFFHFGLDTPPFNNGFFRPLLVNAGLAVSYFFVLSGFVMIMAYGQRSEPVNARKYLINRAARIMPVYYAAMLLMLFYYFIRIYVLNVTSSYYPNLPDTLLNTILLQSWFPEKALTLNPPAWSLSVEAFFYLTFPFICNRIYKQLPLNRFLLLVAIFFIVSQLTFHFLIYTYPSQIYYFYFQPLLRLNEFLVGIATGAVFIHRRSNIRHPFILLLCLVVLAAGLLYIDVFPVDFHNGLFALLFAPMLYFVAINQGRLYRMFSKKILSFLGEISYAVYIFQQPVYFLFTATLAYFGYKIKPPLFYVYLLILLLVSALSYRFIEVPLRKRIRSKSTTVHEPSYETNSKTTA